MSYIYMYALSDVPIVVVVAKLKSYVHMLLQRMTNLEW